MDFRPIQYAPDAFQQSLTEDQVRAMCRRVFGAHVHVASALELGSGRYNNTYCVDIGANRPVILRVAPEPGRQFRVEHELMRNEHAAVPFFAPIAPLMPRTLGVDFTHQVIGRDYLFQTMLEGIPAPSGLDDYQRPHWSAFFGQIGIIARSIHAVRGSRFGPVAGPHFATWSDCIIDSLQNMALDLDGVGLDATDVRQVAAAAEHHRSVLDEIVEPHLLHGDLWTLNMMIAPDAAAPTITGVLDCDRASWGDPASDWTIFMAMRYPGTDRDVFWETYGILPSTPSAVRRWLFYQARHIGANRLRKQRLHRPHVGDTYDEMSDVLKLLRE